MRPSVNLDRPMGDLAVTKSDYDDIRRRSMKRKILMRLLALGLPAASFIAGYYSTIGHYHNDSYPISGAATILAPFGYRRRLTFIGIAIVSITVFLIGVYLGQAYPVGGLGSSRYSVFRK
jgi:hypothetical protein